MQTQRVGQRRRLAAHVHLPRPHRQGHARRRQPRRQALPQAIQPHGRHLFADQGRSRTMCRETPSIADLVKDYKGGMAMKPAKLRSDPRQHRGPRQAFEAQERHQGRHPAQEDARPGRSSASWCCTSATRNPSPARPPPASSSARSCAAARPSIRASRFRICSTSTPRRSASAAAPARCP